MKTLTLDFLGKDSVHYKKDIQLPDDIYAALKEVWEKSNEGEEVFKHAGSKEVGDFLNKIHPGISPKQLRTAKCNEVLIENLRKATDSKGNPISKDSSDLEKYQAIYKANLQIATTLNHQKNVSKNYKEQETKMKDKVSSSKDKLDALKKKQDIELKELDKKEADIKERYKNLPKIKKEKLAGIKTKREKLKARIEKANKDIEKAKMNLQKKKETKDINLGTSLAAYASPKIIYSWCKDVGLDIKKIYTAALQTKFDYAKDTPEDYWRDYGKEA